MHMKKSFFMMSVAAVLLNSCVMQSALHRPIFDWGREGDGKLVKGHRDVVEIDDDWHTTVSGVTVYRAGGKLYVAAHPTTFVRRNRTWLITLQDDHPHYIPDPDESVLLYGEVVKNSKGYLVRTDSPWLDSLPAGAVKQSGKMMMGNHGYCSIKDGIILDASPLGPSAHALWAYPLGTVAAVADVPLTVGLWTVGLPVLYVGYKIVNNPLTRQQEPRSAEPSGER